MLYPLVESALPEETLKAWERARTVCKVEAADQANYLSKLLEFLRLEVESEERLQLARSSFSNSYSLTESRPENPKSTENKLPTAACIFSGEVKKPDKCCVWCGKSSHSSMDCLTGRKLSLPDRKDLLKKKGACFTCLRIGHTTKRCKCFVRCLICSKRHYAIMCPELPSASVKIDPVSNQDKKTEVLITHKSGPTLLQTILVRILHNGEAKMVRALFDSGAQRSYVRRDIVERLGIKPSGQEMLSHSLFGGVQVKQRLHKIYKLSLQGLHNMFECNIPFLDEASICGYVPRIETQDLYPLLKERNIILTDVGEGAPDIGILIGADALGSLLTGNIVHIERNLVAIETKLGWTLQGPMTNAYNLLNSLTNVCNLDLSDLWNLETIGIKDPTEADTKGNSEASVTEFFHQTIRVNEENRYEVSLPWKEGHPDLLDNKEVAKKRLFATTKRLLDMGLFKDYDQIFKEWLDSGIVETVPEDNGSGHYLPHRAVVKDSSLTTRIRPVFDASAKDANGNSLNACVEKGPNFVEMIPQLLVQFRKRAIGVISDIKRAFLQISLAENDRDFLKFLWWENEDREKIVTFRHCRVVFGVSSSPFLLGATLSYHLDRASEELQQTASQLKHSFYVDNCVTSVETEAEAERFIKDSTELMSQAQFELRGWVAAPTDSIRIGQDQEVVPVLGMSWDIKKDELYCDAHNIAINEGPITKRVLLSVAQKLFDPIGFTCPTSLVPKLILQRTWEMKYGWDDELPQEITKEFQNWLKHIHLLNDCLIPRRLTVEPLTDSDVSLHVFCDASKISYASCVFLRVKGRTEISVRLIQSKSRVAPLKKITIPRLELLAALIGTRLCHQVKLALDIPSCKTYFWSDSTVALTWIKKEEEWNVFVGNRVREIRQYSHPEDWYHVPGSLNPADLPSRGCNAKILLDSQWWEGPQWLRSEPSTWITSEVIAPEEEVNSERRKTAISNVDCNSSDFTTSVLTYFSKYTKIVRMVGWIMRFANNSLQKENKRFHELTCEEVLVAERKLLGLIQTESFRGKDMKVLKEMQTFEDQDGLIRIKTKLVLGEEEEDFKCPILLPSDHEIVRRIVHEKHCQLQHAGLQTLLSNLRETYWIIGIRRLAKRIISQCVICKRHKGKAVEPPFAPLPKDRVKYAGVFEVTGIDLAGPLYLLSGEKVWIVLFTCAIYRAIHLELTKSLSTESFIMALKRFIARRGRVSIIYTDNGTNFVGTNNALQNFNWDEIMSCSTVQRIKWKFNPPTAAWWGGWWERLVRMVKDLLRRILGRATVRYEELETILCDCEATINSRPLTYVDNDPEGLKPLTPATFMQGIPHNEVPDLDAVDASSLNRRLRYLQKLRVDLRQRFRNEYLAMLIHRGQRKGNTLHVGDVVLVGSEMTKRINWPLGVVLEIYPGQDG